jgi:hypothetical protein
MLDFLRGMKRLFVFLLVLGCSFGLGCKSPANRAEADSAAAKKARGQGAGDLASGQNTGTGVGRSASGYERGRTSRSDDEATEEVTKERAGGDPDIYHPPKHAAQARERVVETATASTPTPTPSRPIDRPLDPSGKPLTAPSPGE